MSNTFLGYAPYGWKRTKGAHKNAQLRNGPWPKWLPSFEVWCAWTNYRDEPDGGVQFQRQMHLLLVEGTSSENVIDSVKSPKFSYWPESGAQWVGTPESERYLYRGGAQSHCSAANGRVKQQGWGFGSDFMDATERKSVPEIHLEGRSREDLRAIRNNSFTARTFRPCSKFQFIHGIGMEIMMNPWDAKGKATDSNATQLNASGGSAQSLFGDVGGIPSGGNRMAALYGLYYYPDARRPEYNWTQEVEAEGQRFTVRMRLPNPNYAIRGKYIAVQEPLQPQAASYDVCHGIVNQYGTVVPHLDVNFQQADIIGCWIASMSVDPQTKEKKDETPRFTIELAPFFGELNAGPVRDVQQGKKKGFSVRESTRRLSELLDNVHAPEGKRGLILGFRAPAAIWLWPHYVGPGQVLKGSRARRPGDGLANPFQPVPEWADGVNPESGNFFSQVQRALTNERTGLASLLKPPIVEDRRIRMRYALGLDANPRRVGNVGELPKSDGKSKSKGKQPMPPPMTGLQQVVSEPGPSDAPTNAQQTAATVDDELPAWEAPEEIQGQDEDASADASGINDAEAYAPEMRDIGPMALAQGVVNALAENAVFSGETDNEYYTEERIVSKDKAATDKEQKLGIAPHVLEPGAPRRSRDSELNMHFYSADYNPWPHAHLYRPSTAKFRMSEMRDEQRIREYETKYGNVANLFINTHKIPHVIDGVDVIIGTALTCPGDRSRPLWSLQLTAYQDGHPQRALLNGAPEFEGEVVGAALADRFRRSAIQICRIYYDASGKLSSLVSISDKKAGMCNGIHAHSNHGVTLIDAKSGKKVISYKPPVFGKTPGKGLVRVLPAVFRKEPPAKMAQTFLKGDWTGRGSKDDYWERDVSWLQSEMTVLEWLQTPWHYHYLPYQPQSSNFRDGETFSEGCNRCARPFYEYEHRYEAYWFTVPQTWSWPQKYWRLSDHSNEAPVPFHETRFFKEALPEVSVKAQNIQVPLADNAVRLDQRYENSGYHNWRTLAFQIRELPALQFEHRLLTTRIEKNKGKLFQIDVALRSKRVLTFRQIFNENWVEGKAYETLVQGRVTNANAMVRFGMTGYKLMRSTKFGNCCKDCASVLQFAPGLYEMNTRQAATFAVYSDGKRRVNRYTWWANLAALEVNWSWQGEHYTELFDLDYYKTKKGEKLDAKGQYRFQAHMKVARDFLASQHRVPVAADGQALVSKFSRAPDIWVQKTWDRDSKLWNARELREVELANQVLEKIKAAIKRNRERVANGQTPQPLTLSGDDLMGLNNGLYDILQDTQVNMLHQEAFKQSDVTSKFDPDLRRTEHRNVTRGQYKNCLVTQVWQPTDARKEPLLDDKGNPVKDEEGKQVYKSNPQLSTAADQYKEKVYYATRGGPLGDRGTATSQWRGDGYVTRWDAKTRTWLPLPTDTERANVQTLQVRTFKQTRLFITYSLHRAVTTELEARNVLEKMADSVRTLFGTDEYMSDLLIFGMKLETLKNPAKTDTISSSQYVPITKPRKLGTLFYGGLEGNSYLYDTYDTHVDSVDVDVGIEIGPTLHHPHFHALITINHWSYVQLDWYRMKAILEQMYKGLHTGAYDFSDGRFKLVDASGLPFYRDSENAYVQIQLWPTDNWKDVIAAYVRKNASPSIFESLKRRTGTLGSTQSTAPLAAQ